MFDILHLLGGRFPLKTGEKENESKWQPFKSLYNEFKIANDLESKDYSSKRFRKAIDEAAERFGYNVASRRTGSERINEICIESIEKAKNGFNDSIQKTN